MESPSKMVAWHCFKRDSAHKDGLPKHDLSWKSLWCRLLGAGVEMGSGAEVLEKGPSWSGELHQTEPGKRARENAQERNNPC